MKYNNLNINTVKSQAVNGNFTPSSSTDLNAVMTVTAKIAVNDDRDVQKIVKRLKNMEVDDFDHLTISVDGNGTTVYDNKNQDISEKVTNVTVKYLIYADYSPSVMMKEFITALGHMRKEAEFDNEFGFDDEEDEDVEDEL